VLGLCTVGRFLRTSENGPQRCRAALGRGGGGVGRQRAKHLDKPSIVDTRNGSDGTGSWPGISTGKSASRRDTRLAGFDFETRCHGRLSFLISQMPVYGPLSESRVIRPERRTPATEPFDDTATFRSSGSLLSN